MVHGPTSSAALTPDTGETPIQRERAHAIKTHRARSGPNADVSIVASLRMLSRDGCRFDDLYSEVGARGWLE